MKKLYLLYALFPCVLGFSISDEEFSEILRAQRQIEAHTTKSSVAEFDEKKSVRDQLANGDESLYADLRGNYNKVLRHLSSGFPDSEAFESMRFALTTGKPNDFLDIILGRGIAKLANPQASLAFTLSANDGWIHVIPPAPAFASAEAAGEMVEIYWTALVRDVPFNKFSSDPTALAAIADLNTLSDFRGPKINGMVTPETFLRGNTRADIIGPYISQFLYLTVPYGNNEISPEQIVPLPGIGNDFMTNFADWFAIENGGIPTQSIAIDGTRRFIRTPRDLSEYVHLDSPGQAAFSALLILNGFGESAFAPNNPYLFNPTQDGFVTFGLSQVLALMQAAVQAALKAAWYQKWQVHRRLRPEEFGFYVQQQVFRGKNLGIQRDLTQSAALPAIFTTYGTYFLPQAYPEGSPAHPSYPSGHAASIGAAVTILKAFFNEDFIIPLPVFPNSDNTALIGFSGILTIGNELNKLASNIALGRDHAGVHYRSDAMEGLLLGEATAIDILNNDAFLFNEEFSGYTITKFDGTKVIVGAKRTRP